jgi:hypothetical protein
MGTKRAKAAAKAAATAVEREEALLVRNSAGSMPLLLQQKHLPLQVLPLQWLTS